MTQSNTDWVRLASGTQGDPTEEHPEAEVRHVVRGIVRQGLKPLPAKASVSLRIDQDGAGVAQGSGYQTRINSVLKAFRDASVNP
ncbi:MAG: BrnA antitoxin family protein [Thiolinea sp.]